jgi:hypothetical protein
MVGSLVAFESRDGENAELDLVDVVPQVVLIELGDELALELVDAGNNRGEALGSDGEGC